MRSRDQNPGVQWHSPQSVLKESWAGYVDLPLILPSKIGFNTQSLFAAAWKDACSRSFPLPNISGSKQGPPGHTFGTPWPPNPHFSRSPLVPAIFGVGFNFSFLSFPLYNGNYKGLRDVYILWLTDRWFCFKCMHTKCLFNQVLKTFVSNCGMLPTVEGFPGWEWRKKASGITYTPNKTLFKFL